MRGGREGRPNRPRPSRNIRSRRCVENLYHRDFKPDKTKSLYNLLPGGSFMVQGCSNMCLHLGRYKSIEFSILKNFSTVHARRFSSNHSVKAKVVQKSELKPADEENGTTVYFIMIVDDGESQAPIIQYYGANTIFPKVHVGEEYYFMNYTIKSNIPSFSGLENSILALHAQSYSRIYSASIVPAPQAEDSLLSASISKVKNNTVQNPEQYFGELAKLHESLLVSVLDLLNYKEMFSLYYRPQKLITSLHMTTVATNMENDLLHAFTFHVTSNSVPSDVYLHNVFSKPDIFSNTSRDQHEIELPKIFTRGDQNEVTEFPIVPSLPEFKRRFNLFTGGILEGLDWTNFMCAGGSVLACLLNNIPANCTTDEEITNYFLHDSPFAKSDIDLYTGAQYRPKENGARATQEHIDKVKHVYQVVSSNLAKKGASAFVTRTASCVSIISGFPHRVVQVVFCHRSPLYVLSNFDLDCCCVAYNVNEVWASPRAVRAITRRYNLGNPLRLSNSYENRALKYAMRGFTFAFPGLDRNQVKQSTIEKWGPNILGNLLFLEKGIYQTMRTSDVVAYDVPPEDPMAEDSSPEDWLVLPERQGKEYSPPIPWGYGTTQEQLYAQMKNNPEMIAVSTGIEEIISSIQSQSYTIEDLTLDDHTKRFLPLYWVGDTLGDKVFEFEDPHYSGILREQIFLHEPPFFNYY